MIAECLGRTGPQQVRWCTGLFCGKQCRSAQPRAVAHDAMKGKMAESCRQGVRSGQMIGADRLLYRAGGTGRHALTAGDAGAGEGVRAGENDKIVRSDEKASGNGVAGVDVQRESFQDWHTRHAAALPGVLPDVLFGSVSHTWPSGADPAFPVRSFPDQVRECAFSDVMHGMRPGGRAGTKPCTAAPGAYFSIHRGEESL